VMDRLTTNGGGSVLTLAQWRAQTGQDAHSRVATPTQLFVAPTQDDYHLAATSPALDAGETRADVTTDLEGVPRPQGAGTDAGAYERRTAAGDPIFGNGFDVH